MLPTEHDMVDRKRAERLQVMLTDDELRVLDDWRFRARMPSRAAAIRELLKRGLAAEGFSSASTGAHSGDFGVVERARPGPGADGAGVGAPEGAMHDGSRTRPADAD